MKITVTVLQQHQQAWRAGFREGVKMSQIEERPKRSKTNMVAKLS